MSDAKLEALRRNRTLKLKKAVTVACLRAPEPWRESPRVPYWIAALGEVRYRIVTARCQLNSEAEKVIGQASAGPLRAFGFGGSGDVLNDEEFDEYIVLMTPALLFLADRIAPAPRKSL